MVAADNATQSGTNAALAVVLRDDVFVELTAARGATNDTARARLLGLSRDTIGRMRKRQFTPRLETAVHVAAVLGTTVDDLFERAAAA